MYTLQSLRSFPLGRQGENLARTVEIDISEWLSKWPDAQIELAVRRPHEEAIYIVPTFVEGSCLHWPVTLTDTVRPGKGEAELRAYSGAVVVKSTVFNTLVLPCLQGTVDGTTDQTSAVLGTAILGKMVLA